MHRALGALPELEGALLQNTLPWSKARLVARVATAANERAWIARAQAISTRALEREVREACSGAASGARGEDEPLRRVTLRCTPALAEKWSAVRELAERVAGQRLTAGEALELVLAEAVSALPVDPIPVGAEASGAEEREPRGDRADETAAGPAPAPRDRSGARRAQPPCDALRDLADELEGVDAFELDRRLREAIRLEQTLDAAMAPLLRTVRSAEYEWSGGGPSRSAFVHEELGISARKARALVRLERVGDVCPELREAYREGQLSWVKAQCLVPLLQLDLAGSWRAAWVAWASRVTVRRLSEDVERALLLRAGHHRAWQRCKDRPERAQDPIPESERQLCAPGVDVDATHELVWRLPADVAVWLVAVREGWRSRLAAARGRRPSDGEVWEQLLDHALWSWTRREPGASRPDPVIERDGYRCVVPGCTSRRNLQDHHVRFRSAGGSNARENRATLCAFHHLRGVHGGRVRVRGTAPDRLVFELGLRSGRAPLERYQSGDVAVVACEDGEDGRDGREQKATSVAA